MTMNETVTVTITPTADHRWPDLKPVTLRNPTNAVIADIIKTYARNNVRYKITYSNNSAKFKYPLAASFTSR